MAGLQTPLMLFVVLLSIPAFYLAFIRTERPKKIVAVVQGIVILLVGAAAAGPFIDMDRGVTEDPEIIVLKDESTSASVMEEPELDFENVQVTERVIASGNSSELRRGMLRNLEDDKSYLAISDFQSTGESLDGVQEEFNSRNATLNALKTEMDDEASVSINGPERTVPGAENRFEVEVHSTEDVPEPEVELDGSPESLIQTGENTWEFSKSFDSEGSHSLEARIDHEGEFSSNDVYYQTIEVVEKPQILIVGSVNEIGEALDEFYNIDYRNTLPDDISDYYSVIATEEVPEEEITPYVTEGNGFIYTGDVDRESPSVLPVRGIDREDQTDAPKIAIVFAKSLEGAREDSECVEWETTALGNEQCTAWEGNEETSRAKVVAFSLVDALPYNTRVGAIAFDSAAYEVSEVQSLATHRESIKQDISRVLVHDRPSYYHEGIMAGEDMVNGTGNIILVTNGKSHPASEAVDSLERSRTLASNLDDDVRLHTVGVGEERNEPFLRELASRGGGQYVDSEESGRLGFQFAAGGAEGRTTQLVVTDSDHFITRNLELRSSVSRFNPVEPRRGSQMLASGDGGQPFLTTWRYGLGNVAVFSGGDEELTRTISRDPELVTRTAAWTVGDPKRKQDEWLRVEDGREPGTVEASTNIRRDGFSRQSENLYTREIQPEERGVYSIEDSLYAYNYPKELEKIGYNEDMESTVQSTGGQIYEPNDMDEIAEDIKSVQQETVTERQSLSPFLLLAALLLFIAQVGYRKVKGKK